MSSLSLRNRCSLRAWLLLPALAVAPACTLIVDAGSYTFVEDCPAGSEGCRCTAVGSCDQGLECRLPGFCVDPGGGDDADGAGSGGSAGDDGGAADAASSGGQGG